MAQNKADIDIPLGLIALDFFGTALLALGLIKMFGGIEIIPSQYLLDDNGWTLIIIGIALILPFALHMIHIMRQRAEQRLIK